MRTQPSSEHSKPDGLATGKLTLALWYLLVTLGCKWEHVRLAKSYLQFQPNGFSEESIRKQHLARVCFGQLYYMLGLAQKDCHCSNQKARNNQKQHVNWGPCLDVKLYKTPWSKLAIYKRRDDRSHLQLLQKRSHMAQASQKCLNICL